MAAVWWSSPRARAPTRSRSRPIAGSLSIPTRALTCRRSPRCAGPHGAFVPKGFTASHSGQALAELGFIVVQIDGMGTNWRSRAFHDVCWKDIADAGFPDRILWIKAAAAKYPYMDVTRVGIYGGSAGGENTPGGRVMPGDFYQCTPANPRCHNTITIKSRWDGDRKPGPFGPHA